MIQQIVRGEVLESTNVTKVTALVINENDLKPLKTTLF